ncbi:MAG TPA: DUF3592 domain-containing protein [Solirubrobacteraceae bacterium]|jgi:hypothetical protein|nr:DUF3592 domain-containing protein [Solirubrobacteraceae bacterium]
MSWSSTDAFGQPVSAPAGIAARDPSPSTPADVPAGPALGDPATSSALHRYRRRGAWITLAGVALLVAFLVVVSIQGQHARWLLEHGGRVEGLVTSVSRGARGGGSVKVDYVVGGRLWHGTISLTETSASYAPGYAVTVVYDPRHPSDIRTPEEKNEPSWTVVPLMVALFAGLFMFVGGAVTLVRARRWRGLLASSPWRPYRVGAAPRVGRRARLRLASPGLEVTPEGSPSGAAAVLGLASTWRWRREGMARHAGETVWLAGDPAGKVVIALPATHELIGASAPGVGAASSYLGAAAKPRDRDPAQVRRARRRLVTALVAQWVLFSAIALARSDGGPVGIAVAAFYAAALLVTAFVLRRSWRKQDGEAGAGPG